MVREALGEGGGFSAALSWYSHPSVPLASHSASTPPPLPLPLPLPLPQGEQQLGNSVLAVALHVAGCMSSCARTQPACRALSVWVCCLLAHTTGFLWWGSWVGLTTSCRLACWRPWATPAPGCASPLTRSACSAGSNLPMGLERSGCGDARRCCARDGCRCTQANGGQGVVWGQRGRQRMACW
jgi:hypothetical protein